MRTLFFVIQKEFLQIFRNRLMLGIILVVPIVQLVILTYAATFEIRNIDVYVVDQDRSPESRMLIDRFAASENFRLSGWSDAPEDGYNALLGGDASWCCRSRHTPVVIWSGTGTHRYPSDLTRWMGFLPILQASTPCRSSGGITRIVPFSRCPQQTAASPLHWPAIHRLHKSASMFHGGTTPNLISRFIWCRESW